MAKALNILGDLRTANRGLNAYLASAGGAKSPEMVGASVALAKAWRKVLAIRGGAQVVPNPTGKPKQRAVGGVASSPGQPPRRQTGVLQRSVAQGVVGAGRRVAVMRFTATILEEGADTRRPAASGRRRSKARKGYKIAPRPSAQRALDLAQSEMVGIFASRTGGRLEESLR